MALAIALGIGALVVVPAPAYLYTLFQRPPTTVTPERQPR
jgi:hypothetical protein